MHAKKKMLTTNFGKSLKTGAPACSVDLKKKETPAGLKERF